jgi:hypothetical protein
LKENNAVKNEYKNQKYYFTMLVLALSLLAFSVANAANIDQNDKYAWGTNVGWLNFNDANGGVTVYNDHLEGYVWGENIGWIRLGTHIGGGEHTYTNDAADTYGVNNDGNGNLSGYAWGTNVGWINFNPTHSQVTIDPETGDFDGYAWGENIGWIHFQNSSPAYKVNTTWRSETKKASTTTSLASSKNPSVKGEEVTFTATVTGGSVTPTGIVTFKEGVTELGTGELNANGIAIFETSSLSVGTYRIVAEYSGDATYDGSSSANVNQVVGEGGNFEIILPFIYKDSTMQ